MRRRSRRPSVLVPLLVTLAAASAACGGSAGTTPTTAPADLRPLLLTAGGLAGGWSATPLPSSDDRNARCSLPAEVGGAVGPDGAVEELRPSTDGPVVVEGAARSGPGVVDYARVVGRLEAAAACRTTGAGGPTSSTFVGVVPFPSVGDRSVAMLFADRVGTVASPAEAVVVRAGADVLVVGLSRPGALDAALLGRVVRAAVARAGAPA